MSEQEEITTIAKLGTDGLGKPTIEFNLDDICKKMSGLEEMRKSVSKIVVKLPADCVLYGIPIVWGHNAN